MKKPIHKVWWYWVVVVFSWSFIVSTLPNKDDAPAVLFGGLVAIIFISIMIGKSQIRKTKSVSYGAKNVYQSRYVHGLPQLKKNAIAELFVSNDKLLIECEKKKFEVKIEQITVAESLKSSDLVQKDKTVIGRGLAGYVMLGPLGSVVGGMSGIGKKDKKGNYLILNYVDSTGETKVMIFNFFVFNQAKSLADSITRKITKNEEVGGIYQL